MLSLDECRKILGADAPADDRQLEEQRAEAYRLARLLLDILRGQGYPKNLPAGPPPDPEK